MKRLLPILLAAVCAIAWVWSPTEPGGTTPICWVERSHDVYLSQAGSSALDFDDVEATVQASLDTWSAVACSDWDFVYAGTTTDVAVGFDADDLEANTNVVVFNETDFWTDSYAALTLITFHAETGRIYDADVEFNGTDYDFSIGQPGGDTFEVEDVLTHELGHFVGLGHSEVVEATMAAGSLPGETFHMDLHADDIEGLCTIYPTGEATPDCPVGGAGDDDDDDGWGESDCSCAQATPGGGLALLLLIPLATLLRR